MKTSISYSLIAAAMACGLVSAQTTAYTTPVGYYNFAGVAGGNVFVPGVVNSALYAGQLVSATSTTLTVAAASLSANAFDEGAVYSTHYVEVTSGPNAGYVLDILSNTTSVITLADNISALGLTGTETITVRKHVTLKSSLADAEASLAAYSDLATFYLADGTSVSYIYGADGGTGWSSDFATADGDLRPVAPGTGFILGIGADVALTVSGTVKSTPTVVALAAGVVNIVGPLDPLVGTTTPLNNTGFGTLAAYTDSITVYQPGPLSVSTSYVPLGDGTISSDFGTPTTDTISNTTGAVVLPGVDTALTLQPGFTVAP
jgi:hypothetical protein